MRIVEDDGWFMDDLLLAAAFHSRSQVCMANHAQYCVRGPQGLGFSPLLRTYPQRRHAKEEGSRAIRVAGMRTPTLNRVGLLGQRLHCAG